MATTSAKTVRSKRPTENGKSQNKTKASFLIEELVWLSSVIRRRFAEYNGIKWENSFSAPDLTTHTDSYAQFIKSNNLTEQERALLILTLAPHVVPDFYDNLVHEFLKQPGDFPKLGGVRGKNFRGMLPTGETAVFVLAGDHLFTRFAVQRLFDVDHLFSKAQVLWLEKPPSGEPAMSGRIIMSQEYVELFTLGSATKPAFSIDFPAQRIETKLDWEDLVLDSATSESVRQLETWVKHGDTLLNKWKMGNKIKPGYRALFYGPPGTGKTLTASLLGKYTGKEVYKIDLSMVVSKFIGETEKNLANLFDKAEHKNWILFFDEADALFGKRTGVRDAHDKYANQEVSFLLQRTEGYNGLVILATNFKSNIDDAFSRRFQSHIYFPIPKYNERYKLWQKSLPEMADLEPGLDLSGIARQYELTGAHIMNVVQYACLNSLARKEKVIRKNDLIEGIKNELNKEGKMV